MSDRECRCSEEHLTCQCAGPLLEGVLDQERRRTEALESIARSLEKLANPLFHVTFDSHPVPPISYGNVWECQVCHTWITYPTIHECPGVNVC